MKIIITGNAEAFDIADGSQVDDASRLEKLDGLLFDEALCSDYLDDGGPLDGIGIRGGQLRLSYEPSKGLKVVTEFQSPRQLTPVELKELIDSTEGQWSDGIGEGEFMHRESTGLDVSVWSFHSGDKPTAEQIDDGEIVPSTPPMPLLVSLRKGEPEKLERLLAEGADANLRGKRGETALQLACLYGYFDAAASLLSYGADVRASDNEGATPLLRLAMCNKGGEQETLRLARTLLENGAEVEARDKDGRTPLMWAANRAKTQLMGFLIERGALVNARDAREATAIMYCQDVRAAELLLRHGADMSLRDIEGNNARDNALRNKHWKQCNELAELLKTS